MPSVETVLKEFSALNCNIWPRIVKQANYLTVVINGFCPTRRYYFIVLFPVFTFLLFAYGIWLLIQMPEPGILIFVHYYGPSFLMSWVGAKLLSWYFTYRTVDVVFDLKGKNVWILKTFSKTQLAFPVAFKVEPHRYANRFKNNDGLEEAYQIVADSLAGSIHVADVKSNLDANLVAQRLNNVGQLIKNKKSARP